MPNTEEKAAASTPAKRDRVFLVVVDDSAEREVALKYAALRARKGGGRVALLRVIEPMGQVEWAGVGAMMQEEAQEEAEKLLAGLAALGCPVIAWRGAGTLDDVLRRLSPEHRAILVLRDIEELDTEEAASMLGISPNAVKVRLHRARQALRTLLERRLANAVRT